MADRIIIQLTPAVTAKLKKLTDRTGRSKTSIVNDAVMFMKFLSDEGCLPDANLRKGVMLIIRDSDGNEKRVKFL